jgi:hypothetical protein
MMAAGLRATAKAVEHPPEPKVGAPVLDPTAEDHIPGAHGAVAEVAQAYLCATTNTLLTRQTLVIDGGLGLLA